MVEWRVLFVRYLVLVLLPTILSMISFYVSVMYGLLWWITLIIPAVVIYKVAKPRDIEYDDKKSVTEERMRELIEKVVKK